ncbi:hypothetical protein R3P38DRAFT_2867299 [Favolaschia claudopus]|uniref:Fungal-type protein kinase domain-containing protein n=1 Tax=Favolaschia claudopus TaxID=2862362 RepID=A0AAW0D8R3_9AGAR
MVTDDTVSTPTLAEKNDMYFRLCGNTFYKERYQNIEEATDNSLWITAALNRIVGGKKVSQLVRCFTFGEPLFNVDNSFGCATRVYRVILEDDKSEPGPTVYALKDSWRRACRRPEVDFYDAIVKYCEKKGIDTKGMAQCHGSLDLADKRHGWDASLHVTMDAANHERRHTRILLTPVGGPLNEFKSTKALAQALSNAVRHLQIASDAGVLHRDVSEGNLLLQEVPDENGEHQGFLIDWDHAEFTLHGFKFFEQEFKNRARNPTFPKIEESLKYLTGTLPFIAIGVLEEQPHTKHHDLESVHWLLVWMILRHTAHTIEGGPLACNSFFDQLTNDARSTIKRGDLAVPFGAPPGPLHALVNALRFLLKRHYFFEDPEIPLTMSGTSPFTHEAVLHTFSTHLASAEWPPADKALEFKPPKLETYGTEE